MAQLREVFIKDTHRGLWYEDGVFLRVLEAGRYRIPRAWDLWFWRTPVVEVHVVDVRERELLIKGQEILTADKVAIRVSIVVQFRVTDPKAALHNVASYEERLYSDVQLAARRSLASMPLEEILTNRNRLNEDILRDVKEAAATYGVAILRSDVKDLVFPGNLQEIMNRVLAAERKAQADLVDARSKADMQRIEAATQAENQKLQVETAAHVRMVAARADAEAMALRTDAEVRGLREREKAAEAYEKHPALLRLRELEAMAELGKSANARIYVGFPKHVGADGTSEPSA
jgi:regulator of protease activity HflC (stomatin/prohibitin superfamily)